MPAEDSVATTCTVCKKPRETIWACGICEAAGRPVAVCSPRCRRVHERDGLHRKQKRLQTEAGPAD